MQLTDVTPLPGASLPKLNAVPRKSRTLNVVGRELSDGTVTLIVNVTVPPGLTLVGDADLVTIVAGVAWFSTLKPK